MTRPLLTALIVVALVAVVGANMALGYRRIVPICTGAGGNGVFDLNYLGFMCRQPPRTAPTCRDRLGTICGDARWI